MDYKKPLIAVVVLIVLGITGAAGMAGYQKYFLTPERIIKKSIVNLMNSGSYEYAGDVQVDFLGYRFSGAVEKAENDKEKGWFRTNIKMGATVSTNMEFRLVDDTYYMRFGPSTNTFIGKTTPAEAWMKIGRAELVALFEEAEQAAGGGGPLWYQKFVAESDGRIEAEKRKLYKEAEIFQEIVEQEEEKLKGKDTRHYTFVLDKEAWKELLVSDRELDGMPYTEEELADLETGFDKMENISGEIWIGRKDMLPYKVTVKTEYEGSDMIGNVITVKPDEMTPEGIAKRSGGKATNPPKSIGLQFTLNFKNYDKSIKVTVPKNAKSAEEELKNMIPGFFPESAEQRDASKATENMKTGR